MHIVITKQNIIDALTKEDLSLLRPGTWFDRNTNAQTCGRCAVGSLLAHTLQPPSGETESVYFSDQIRVVLRRNSDGFDGAPNGFDSSEQAREQYRENFESAAVWHIDRKYFMNALSYAFEGYAEYYDYFNLFGSPAQHTALKMIRKATIEFVEKHFPEEFTLDVNGFKVKDHVRIVPTV